LSTNYYSVNIERILNNQGFCNGFARHFVAFQTILAITGLILVSYVKDMFAHAYKNNKPDNSILPGLLNGNL
jgi:hypothetical protein